MSLFTNEVANLGDTSTVGGNKIQGTLHLFVPLAAANTAQPVFIAPVAYKILSVREVHAVAGGAAAAVDVEKLTGTQAAGAGVSMLAAVVSVTGTANTVQTVNPSTTLANTLLAAGDRIDTKYSGTLTGLAGGLLEIILARA